ncbi:MAG: hypothetical protein LBG95_01560 [Treponema sp.]|jgi:transposase-like protein|nr:hypothetical protein [Treponema sp.]
MKKIAILFLALAIAGIAFFSCYDDPAYCPRCRTKTLVEDGKDSEGAPWYKCTRCGNKFIIFEV